MNPARDANRTPARSTIRELAENATASPTAVTGTQFLIRGTCQRNNERLHRAEKRPGHQTDGNEAERAHRSAELNEVRPFSGHQNADLLHGCHTGRQANAETDDRRENPP